MSELYFSTSAIEAMREAGWDYSRPCSPGNFLCSYYQCSNRVEIARDLKDYTGYDVSHYDTSVDKGYWYVSLRTDAECLDFAKRYNEYDHARQRISNALFNGVLLLTKGQYDKVAKVVDRYDKRFVGDWVMIAIPEDEFTRHVVAMLDALGI
jgi:hypothetical protein